ncbi:MULTISPECIES: hypothetical protein [unclassified Mesorhizobium]|uniref:hypothetical protein n=1 Tax=unclassified Mesorhizobium TaxID=325217 RepID=UPI000FCB62D7|nr:MULTISPECIES: hypothetical protein [unclassified Mesorhizobium]
MAIFSGIGVSGTLERRVRLDGQVRSNTLKLCRRYKEIGGLCQSRHFEDRINQARPGRAIADKARTRVIVFLSLAMQGWFE